MSKDDRKKFPTNEAAKVEALDEDILAQRLSELEHKTEEALKPKGVNVLSPDDEDSVVVVPGEDEGDWFG